MIALIFAFLNSCGYRATSCLHANDAYEPKKTFTSQQLMDEFWDADTETTPRAVDMYMTKLRSKLSECDDFEIKTVHGLGYKAVIK